MTKESLYELQKIDCNCNDCSFLERDLQTYNAQIKKDKETQLSFFEEYKKRAIENALEHRDAEKREAALKSARALKHTYTPQRVGVSYGVCKQFKKPITFIANTLQLETQNCFNHRLDSLPTVEKEARLEIFYEYSFYYPHTNVLQTKILIPHEYYEKYKKIEDNDEAKKYLKKVTQGKEWFTDKSPLFEAITTGILNCNGIYRCEIKKLKRV